MRTRSGVAGNGGGYEDSAASMPRLPFRPAHIALFLMFVGLMALVEMALWRQLNHHDEVWRKHVQGEATVSISATHKQGHDGLTANAQDARRASAVGGSHAADLQEPSHKQQSPTPPPASPTTQTPHPTPAATPASSKPGPSSSAAAPPSPSPPAPTPAQSSSSQVASSQPPAPKPADPTVLPSQATPEPPAAAGQASPGIAAKAANLADDHHAEHHAAPSPHPPSEAELAASSHLLHSLRSRSWASWGKAIGGAAPIPPVTIPDEKTPILVELSAFQDGARCARTLQWSLEKATHPERLSFHVVDAHAEGEPDCATIFQQQHLPQLCSATGKMSRQGTVPAAECQKALLSRMKAWFLHAKFGMGPVHQRGVSGEVMRYETNDTMCLSMDSHMDFRPGWDTTMIEDWKATKNEFAILTAYPMDFAMLNFPDRDCVDLCGYLMEQGVPRGRQGGNVPKQAAPWLTMNWAAGLSFHRCHMERAVPVDWNMRWIFTGEEVNRAVRAWTSGYDLYLPQNSAVVHEYKHAKQTFQQFGSTDVRNKGVIAARERLHKLFDSGLPGSEKLEEAKAEFGRFGLGQQRSLEDFVRWSGVNLGGKWENWMKANRVQETPPRHSFCRSLQRKPVRDEVALLASIGTKPSAEDGQQDAGAEVEIDGDPGVHCKRIV
eukprot:TRINITY_DN102578_c0_g1_i1.p1 TRINITY_DN102578_c0_g1~~TRINITY_DN102578_c0_g1_i1.p1  ORF type:complete len:664 (-),score=168.33 TRINITY_DN102578_c0_g1_i1:83-2074(-)